MFTAMLIPASALIPIVFLLGQLTRANSVEVTWLHVRRALINLSIVAVVIVLTKWIEKKLDTAFPLLAVIIPVTVSLCLPLDHPEFRTARMLWICCVPENRARQGQEKKL